MAKLDLLIQGSNDGHWEFSEVFKGLANEDLWRRAHPKLLSVGELPGHVAYWEANTISSYLPEGFQSPLVQKCFDYYTNEVDNPVVLELSVEEVANEMKRIHEIFVDVVTKIDPDFSDLNADRPQMTWGQYLQYQVFHVAYHAGQAYSVRHLMGHATTDN